jgi:hypothetical protein
MTGNAPLQTELFINSRRALMVIAVVVALFVAYSVTPRQIPSGLTLYANALRGPLDEGFGRILAPNSTNSTNTTSAGNGTASNINATNSSLNGTNLKIKANADKLGRLNIQYTLAQGGTLRQGVRMKNVSSIA